MARCAQWDVTTLWLGLLPFALSVGPLSGQDTTIVVSDGAPVWTGTRLVEELRIGTLDGDDPYIFGQVSYVVPTADGGVWVVDGQGPRVRIFDREGRYVRDVARVGEGPGEIASVRGIDVTPDGRVAVWDRDNSRVSLFHPDGEYDEAFRVVSGWWRDESFKVDRDGRFWVFTSIANPVCVRTYTAPDGTTQEIGSEAPGCQTMAYLRFTPDGEPIDTVRIPVPQDEEPAPSFTVTLPEGGVRPFVPEWSDALSPLGYFVTAHSSRYAVTLQQIGPEGGNATRIERSYQPVRLGRAERGEWQARADFYDRTLQPTARSYGVEIPDEKPPLRSVRVDLDGRIWVHRYVAAEKRSDVDPEGDPGRPPPLTWREPPTFDVFEPSGRFLGTVVTPRNVRMGWRAGDVLWGVLSGPLDEPYVVRYRLVTDDG